jgi:signal transduction histidine kinase
MGCLPHSHRRGFQVHYQCVNEKKPRLQESRVPKRPTANDPRTYRLEDDAAACRVLIDSMNEGVLTLTREGVILSANQSFARMVKRPLKLVKGCSFYSHFSTADHATLRLFLHRSAKTSFKMEALLNVHDDLQLPVKISARGAFNNASKSAILCLVVTNMTETHRFPRMRPKVELLRNLVRHFTQTQEAERQWVTGQFHKSVSQLAYAVLVRCGTLVKNLPARESASKAELKKVCDLTGQMIESIRRISHILRPSALDDLGLVPVLRADCEEFAKRTRIRLNLDGVRMIGRLSSEVEIALYRIFQIVLKNVQQHAHARHVTVGLTRRGAFVQLAIKDDGVGFDQNQAPAGRKEKDGFGLAGMRERAACLGGALNVKSTLRAGTEIEVRIPLSSGTSFSRAKNARFLEN